MFIDFRKTGRKVRERERERETEINKKRRIDVRTCKLLVYGMTLQSTESPS